MKTLNRIAAVLLYLVLASIGGFAQDLPKEPLSELFAGKPGSAIYAMAENQRGEIAAAGQAAKGENGGADIFILLLDKDFKTKVQRYIGRNADDGANHVAAGLDGRWLVAGYSEQPPGSSPARGRYFGKRDAWFVILDENGRVSREFIFGTAVDDEFTHVTPLPDGGFLLCGYSGMWAWLLRLTADGEVVWQKKMQYHQLITCALSAVVTLEEQVFLCGYVAENGKRSMWMTGFNLEGIQMFEEIFPASQATVGHSIVELGANTLAIAGYHTDKKLRDNAFLCKTDKNGALIECRTYGGKEPDQASAMTLLHNGNLLLAGSSKSFERGSRRNRAWVTLISPEGELKTERFYGSKTQDEAHAALQCHDGRILVAGFSGQSMLKTDQAWVMHLTKPSRPKPPTLPLIVSAQPVWYPNGEYALPGDRIFIPLQVENKSDGGAVSLKAVLHTRDEFAGTQLLGEISLPPLPSSSRRLIGLPLPFPDPDWPAIQQVKIQLFQGERMVSDEVETLVRFSEAKLPQLKLGAQLDQGKLEVSLLNSGQGTAQGVSLFFSGIQPAGLPEQVFIGDLKPGETAVRSLTMNSPLPGAGALRIRASDAELFFSDTIVVEFRSAEVTVAAGMDTLQRGNFLTAIWVNPNPDQFDHRDIVWPEEEITVTVKVVSNKPIEKQHFCIEINGQPCSTGAKFEEVQMRGARFSRTFQQRVKLAEGVNSIQAVVNNEAGASRLDALSVVYAPRSPNLHLLSIGVPSADLKFTTHDARNFAASLTKGNKAFAAIFTDTLFAENTATKTEILKSLRRLQYRFADRQIARQDLLIVFISSHGLNAEGRFRIAAADYDGPFLQETSLDFEDEVIRYLQTIECRQLFVVDACHSGSANLPIRASGTGLAGLAASKSGLNLLASCREEEYSYEDEAWRNGAFTKAIMQAISTFSEKPSEVDLNGDGQLDVNELFRFLQKHIPVLVSAKRPKTPTSQTPLLITAPSERPIVLFKK